MLTRTPVALFLLVAAGPALAMDVQTFITKADALKAKGALALFSGDLKKLTNQVKADAAALRSENQALSAAGKRKAYCTPDKFGMDEEEVLRAMRAVPVERRASTTTKMALRDHLARRYPCSA